jgi:leucyl/phenylalanyl-tRNA--protein transferase
MIPPLGDAPDSPFPAPAEALPEPDGLLAWGGDLSPERLLNAYGHGIFPWYSEDDPILWWSPAERCILRPEELHLSRRLLRRLRSGAYSCTADRCFEQVVQQCARTREETWISDEMAQAYTRLHRLGHAHSIELWLDNTLAGGLYGVALGRMFFGESMFSAVTDGSKMVLAYLGSVMQAWNMPMLDCQVVNPHLLSMGATLIPRHTFLAQIAPLVIDQQREPGSWAEPWDTMMGNLDPQNGSTGTGTRPLT